MEIQDFLARIFYFFLYQSFDWSSDLTLAREAFCVFDDSKFNVFSGEVCM